MKTNATPEWFKCARLGLGLSQAKLAAALNLDKNTVYRKEREDGACGVTSKDVEAISALYAQAGKSMPAVDW